MDGGAAEDAEDSVGGQAVSMLGDGLAIVAVPLLVMQLTRSLLGNDPGR